MADVQKIDTVEVEITANTESFDENVAKLPNKLKETVSKLNSIKSEANIKVFLNNKELTKTLEKAIPKVEIPADVKPVKPVDMKSKAMLEEEAKESATNKLARQQEALQKALQQTNNEFSKLASNMKSIEATAKGDVTQNLKYKEIAQKLKQLENVREQLNVGLSKLAESAIPKIDESSINKVENLERKMSNLSNTDSSNVEVKVETASSDKSIFLLMNF